jgi:hypothetical protein
VSEEHISSELYEEILRNTDKKNYVRLEDRILRKTMVQLVKSGHATFLFLADDEARDYWAKLAKSAAIKVEKRKEAKRLYEVKQAAWDRLSEEDRNILKLRKPTPPRG